MRGEGSDARPLMNDFTHLVDLASPRLGGAVLLASDEFFAAKENLIKPEMPVFREHEYTDRGKWMDGWETRRRRAPGHDWCLLRLGLPGILRGVVVDTTHFRGNYPELCSIDGCALEGSPGVEQLTRPETRWVEVFPKTALRGDTSNRFAIHCPNRLTHLRFHIYPDGGVARLRVYGEALPDWAAVLSGEAEIDLASVEHGGQVLAASDTFFGAPQNLLMPGRGLHMADGWETKRRRGPGFDWVILKLGIAGTFRRIEVDTAHFKGNYPESCSLEACRAVGLMHLDALAWRGVLPRTKLEADQLHVFEREIADAVSAPFTHVRFNIYPDGGVSRLRIFGVPSRDGRLAEGLRRLNALLPDEAEATLHACGGSARWARRMAAGRPYSSLDHLYRTDDGSWDALTRKDWLEAFLSHRASGEQETGPAEPGPVQEQAGLAEASAAYQERFGHPFIVCATGKSLEEMLALCRQRLSNDPETEFRIAANEQRKIARLRLEKLLTR